MALVALCVAIPHAVQSLTASPHHSLLLLHPTFTRPRQRHPSPQRLTLQSSFTVTYMVQQLLSAFRSLKSTSSAGMLSLHRTVVCHPLKEENQGVLCATNVGCLVSSPAVCLGRCRRGPVFPSSPGQAWVSQKRVSAFECKLNSGHPCGPSSLPNDAVKSIPRLICRLKVFRSASIR